MLREACFVWNHALALQKRHYALYHKYIGIRKMKSHFARRIKRNLLHSQTVQEILERLDTSYQRFFSHMAKRPPKFKRAKDFSSFLFKQGGFKLSGNRFTVNKISKTYKFSLSRHPDVLGEPKGFVIEPIPTDEDVSSLSAIIMDDDYYHFTIAHSQLTDGIRHANSAALIALKARAYLNLVADKRDGKHVNTKDIKKHRSDILKNVVIMTEDNIEAPASIVVCIREFVASIRADWTTLAEPFSRSLGQDEAFVTGLLDQLDELFIEA